MLTTTTHATLLLSTLLISASSSLAQSVVVPTTTAAPVTAVVPATITTAPVATTAAVAATSSAAGPLPLTDYLYPYDSIPYQVYPFAVGRGPQSGINQCNSTTVGPNSECQTVILNSISDFCLWGSPETSPFPNSTIGNLEAAVVAYCTSDAHGTRIMPAGTITALQFMRTSEYIQIVGLLNQTGLNIESQDTGGELDPHGADLAGNPLGGLVYSTGLTSANGTTYKQSQSWNLFVGHDKFCFKVCTRDNGAPNYCQNIYDLIGCDYNMPAAYTPNVFVSCDGDLQSVAGTYTSGTATLTWSQPRPTIPAGYTLPWTPFIPASSNCVTYQSTDLFPNSKLGYQSQAAAVVAGGSAGATSRAGSSPTSGSSRASAAGASSTTTTNGATGRQVGGAGLVVVVMAMALVL